MEVVKTTATEILGMQKLQRILGWRDEEYDKAVAEKNLLYQKNVQRNTRATKEAFQNKRREVVKLARQKEIRESPV
ncbi:hypothetical protein OMK64_20430 [Cellulomonas fimi]|uniref:hypothetical protein n=1 Tax=Cellulomonas fimi TaxID=1708 RepID=UPI00234CC387|nr:hypothetical protein [Cellulomonas fimi]MDC7123903.1 hypothetical protein [Cellulomonas fimi]